MDIKRTHRRRHCLRGVDKIRGPYFFDYWPFSLSLRTLWHLVSWCRSILSCRRTIPNGAHNGAFVGSSDNYNANPQRYAYTRAGPIAVRGPCAALSAGYRGPDKDRLSGHFSVRSVVDRAPKFDAFYGPLFRESMRIRVRERRDNTGNPFKRSTTCLNGYHLDGPRYCVD